jgi:hypothetical protein
VSALLEIFCLVGCGASDKVPAREVRGEPGTAPTHVPVQGHPYVCLKCWRQGWRSKAPEKQGESWSVYQGSPTT